MKHALYAGVALSLLLLGTNAQAQPNDSADQVNRLFADWDRKDSPGCVVLVRHNGKTVHERAYGMSNLELGVPLTLSSVFLLASVSKQFVVFLIMLLAQGGRLSLDDDVRKHVPEVPDFGKTITIRHLIHHTSGLREDLTSFNLAGWRSGDSITRDDFLRFVKNQKALNFEPGSQYLYCNTGYHLLAIIVERVGGQPMPLMAQKEIFAPLGMKSTVVRDSHRMLIPNLASPYGPRLNLLKEPGILPTEFVHARVAHDPPGASNVHSTVGDLAKWDQNFYDATVGSVKLLEQMQTRAKLNSGKDIKYGGGLSMDNYRGLKTVTHTGSHGGYKTVLFRVPDERFSVIILANQRDFVPLRYAKRIADIYLGRRMEANPELAPAKETDTVDIIPGEYRIGHSLWRVVQNKSTVYVQVDGGEKKRLIAAVGNQLFDREDGTRFRFVKKGEDVLLETTFEKQKSTGKLLRDVQPSAKELSALTGTYRSAELGTLMSLTLKKDKLVLEGLKGEATLQFIQGGECIARPRDAFFSMLAIRFTKDGAGNVTGFDLSTERVRNLRFAKVRLE